MAYTIRTNIDPSSTSGTELADIVEEVGDLTQIVVESDTSNQPGGPSEGDAYIANGDASWVNGSQYDVAVFRDSTWIYHTPEEGWVAYIKDRGEARRFNGTDWNSRLPDSSPEHAADSGTDTYVSATNTDAPKAGDKITRDFQSPNTTTAPELDSLTITTKDGSALWANALSGVHELQLNAGGTAWLVLDPNPSSQVDPIAYADQSEADAESYADAQDATFEQQRAQAWVNFDGTGTVSIRDHYNVSSITDDGTGQWTINFNNNLADANYSPSLAVSDSDTSTPILHINGTPTTSQLVIQNANAGATGVDADIVSVHIMGGN